MPKSSIASRTPRPRSASSSASVGRGVVHRPRVSVISSAARRRRAALAQHRRDADQVGLLELARREVHAHRELAGRGRALPARASAGRPRGAPSAPSGHDQPGLLGERDEVGRESSPRSGCFQRTSASTPASAPVAQVDDRLVVRARTRRARRALRRSRSRSQARRRLARASRRRRSRSGLALPLARYIATSASRSRSVGASCAARAHRDADARGGDDLVPVDVNGCSSAR